jgi:hypothetical protein
MSSGAFVSKKHMVRFHLLVGQYQVAVFNRGNFRFWILGNGIVFLSPYGEASYMPQPLRVQSIANRKSKIV